MIETPSYYDPTDPLLTARKAAERLGVDAETVRRWMRKGAIAYVELGPYRKKRLRASVVEAQRRERIR